jgi:RNA polymerase sigma factor (sigma-70 family)
MTPPFADSTASVRPAGRRAPQARVAVSATDGERLMRFRLHRDEAAFHDVVRAHAPLVWGICWQVLRHREDVEDAFQATFLILARKAGSIRAADSAAGWLYRVAFRTALATRTRRRRLGIEPLVDDPPAALEEQFAAIERSEQCEKLLEELHSLAARYRQPLVLCYLEGRSRQEAADELGLTMATVKGRLARGLRILRTRLAHRGLALSGAAALLTREMATAQASAALAPAAQTAALATTFVYGTPSVGVGTSAAVGTGAAAVTLAKKGLLAMKFATAAKPALGLLAMGMTAGALALAAGDGSAGGSGDDGGASRVTTVVELVADGDEPAVPTEELLEVRADGGDVTAAFAAVDAASDDALTYTADESVATASTDDIAIDDVLTVNTEEIADVLTTTTAPVAEVAVNDVVIKAAAPVGPKKRVELHVQPPKLKLAKGPAPVKTTTLVATAAPAPAASREVMAMEREYWTLKGQGLRHKAEALAIKYRGLEDRNVVPETELLANRAEVELLQAEAILCDARAKQLEEALEAPALPPVGASGATHAAPAIAMTAPANPGDVIPPVMPGIPQPIAAAAPTAGPTLVLTPNAVQGATAAVPPQPAALPTGPAAGMPPQPAVAAVPPPTIPGPAAIVVPAPSPYVPASDAAELDARSTVLAKMAADLKQQFAELRRENEELRRELEKLRGAHNDDGPEPEAF